MTLTYEEAKHQLERACEVNDPEKADEALTAFPALKTAGFWAQTVSQYDAPDIVPVLVRHGVSLTDHEQDYTQVPTRQCISSGFVNALRAFVKAGAPIPPRTFNPYLQLFQTPLTDAARAYLGPTEDSPYGTAAENRTLLLSTLREFGISRSAQPDEDRMITVESEWTQHIRPMLDAGIDIYAALRMPAPKNPLTPDFGAINDAVQQAMTPREEGEGASSDYENNRSIIKQRLKREFDLALIQFPTEKLKADADTFFTSPDHKELEPYVHRWESFGMLPVLFNSAAVPLWKDGINGMLEVYRDLPPHMQQELNIAGLERDTLTPRDNSVTVQYARAQTRTDPPHKG